MPAVISAIFNGFTLVIGFLRKFVPFINKFTGFIGGFFTAKVARIVFLTTIGATAIAALMTCIYAITNGIVYLYNLLVNFFALTSDITKIDSSPIILCLLHYLDVFGITPALNAFLPFAASLLYWFLTFVLCKAGFRAYYYFYKIVSSYA